MANTATGSLGKVAVVGTGAVGGFYGGLLARSGQEVHFLFRSDYEAALKKGLKVTLLEEPCDTFKVEPLRAYRDAGEIGPCDWVIVAAKSTANPKLIEVLTPLLHSQTAFLTLQNGMGNVEWLRSSFGSSRRIVSGLCFTCLNRVAPAEVVNYFPGYVQFGELVGTLSEEGQQIMNAFRKSGVSCKAAESLDEALWRKLCWNVPFNGLTVAAGGITTDLILADQELTRRARSLMEEIQAAAYAHGVEIEDAFLDQQFELTQPMGAYKPSSLIDFLGGREVEVEAIWGEPLHRGQAAGVDMPELQRLHSELTAIQLE
ncbi:MAG: 2-dehydropantoate 2-reductase [Opitutales bacterium]